jgi:hypothetical protein
MREYISKNDFTDGRNFAVVRDVHGTRVAVRNIPRDHQVLVVAAVTVHPVTGQPQVAYGGEYAAGVREGDVEAVINGWNGVLSHVMAAHGVGYASALHKIECPFHDQH